MTPPSNDAPFPEGLYDRIDTRNLQDQLVRVPWRALFEDIKTQALPEVLSAHLAQAARQRLLGIQGSDAAKEQVRLVNELLQSLGQAQETVHEPRRLASLRALPTPGSEDRYPPRAQTPLSVPALLTNTRGEPSMGNEIRGELASADRVDLLCAFIKWYGLRTMEEELTALRKRGIPFRVITTTYMGATDRKAIDRLVVDFGAEVRISYEIERTRLHAKAWLFSRNTAYHTAYVGSSNLSRAALLDGVEWNVRLTQAATPALITKFGATFDTYWNDPAFEPYDPNRDAEKLDQALLEAGGGRRDRVTLTLSGLDVRPYPHQQQVLEALDVEREVHDRHRNLVVAATGTGKTVMAALDYRRLCAAAGRRLTLLFVAHRKEILDQALRTYREVLADTCFGEMMVAGEKPTTWQQVFASVQSLRPDVVRQMDPSQFDVVVIDEFHHAAAASYRELLTHFTPGELLALTATPERTDGIDVRGFFDNRTAAEIRLWDALEAELLCPFHYFGIDDGTDLTAVQWTRGRYDPQGLENLYTGNDARARLVLATLRDKITNLSQMRALGFCVGVAHAQYMARVFNEAGVPAQAVSGSTPATVRAQALKDLTQRRVNVLFTADLLNEGIDLPDVDTVLFLRPTESATIFLQQLGRGLRRTRDKAVLTVLDFVGNQRLEFRYDQRFSAMTGIPRGQLEGHAQRNFPMLPSGCQIILDRQSEHRLLQTLRQQTRSVWNSIVSSLRNSGDVGLTAFLEDTGISLDQVLKNDKSWTRARLEAGLTHVTLDEETTKLLRRGRAFVHVDDPDRINAYLHLLETANLRFDQLSPAQQRYAQMLVYSVWPDSTPHSVPERFGILSRNRVACDEFAAIVAHAATMISHVPKRLGGDLGLNSTLRSHAHYTREELCAALDFANPTTLRQGVFYSQEHDVDVLLVTLNKNEDDFSPTTMYEDYAISPTLFHWQSQSTVSQQSPTGQRYLTQRQTGHDILFFSREGKTNAFGRGVPYLLLGQADYASHRGEKPISLEWELRRPMPESHFLAARIEAS